MRDWSAGGPLASASVLAPQPYQPSPKGSSGRLAHRPFRGLLGVHSRYGLHTRAVTVFRDTLTVGFSHFVTSMTAPVASGWSSRRVGLAPTGKRRLATAHTQSRQTIPIASPHQPRSANRTQEQADGERSADKHNNDAQNIFRKTAQHLGADEPS